MAKNEDTLREAVGVFDNEEVFQDAVDEMLSSGFDRSALSVVAGEHVVEEKLGHMYEKVQDLEDAPDSPRKVFIGTDTIGDAEGAIMGGLIYLGAVGASTAVVMTGGTLGLAFAAAAASGAFGGGIGAILSQYIENHHARYLENQIKRGGLILWVNLRSKTEEKKAVKILENHSAHDVHVHDIPAGD